MFCLPKTAWPPTLNTCVIEAVRGNDPRAREKVLEEISDVFEMSRKV